MRLFKDIMDKIQKISIDNLQIITTICVGSADASIFTGVLDLSVDLWWDQQISWYHIQQGDLVLSRKVR